MKNNIPKINYTNEPVNKNEFTDKLDKEYSKYAWIYDTGVKILPFWKTWIKKAIPLIKGPRVLEASFGTGYLLTKYARNYEVHGIDYNQKMVEIAGRNCRRKNIQANLQKGNVEELPFEDNFFNTIINTMAFSGYPDADKAMSEFYRTLNQNGRLIIIDFNYPENRNRLGMKIVKSMEQAGDIIRDMHLIFQKHNFTFTDQAIGGFGSVHLYIAEKNQ